MTVALLGLTLIAQVAAPSLKFNGKALVIQVDGQKEVVPLRENLPPARMVWSFRKDDKWAVWDSKRGLTIRSGKRVRSTRLAAIPVSPRLFSREEIIATARLIKTGTRKRDASAIAGAKRIGTKVYLLARWTDRAGRPWLEALVEVDFEEEMPAPKLLGRFDGLSLAKAPVDDKLLILGNQLAIVARMGGGWGVARYDPESTVFTSVMLGQSLTRYDALNHRLGLFQEPTTYGTTRVGRVDLANGFRRDLFETRGTAELLDQEEPLLFVLRRRGGPWLRNSETGAEVKIPASARVRKVAAGVLVWSPALKPTFAALYDPSRWAVLARMETPG
ncbi:MAG: hypothetical protein WAO58_13470 [Fimbriimonadaceae bacterium]